MTFDTYDVMDFRGELHWYRFTWRKLDDGTVELADHVLLSSARGRDGRTLRLSARNWCICDDQPGSS